MIISSKSLKDISNFFSEQINYNKLSIIDKNDIIKYLLKINKKYDITLKPSQILEMRDTFIYLLSKTKGTLAHKLGNEIIQDYENKISIIEIAKKYKLPPMSVIYQILIELKYETHIIDNMVKKCTLPKDIQFQIVDIIKVDPMFWFPCNIPNIHHKIDKLKCNYELKYDLKKNGKCPDILFNKICNYKRKKFNWIVFKPYILFDNPLHLHDINKTIINFKRFGIGLILYNEIICSDTFIKKINVYVDNYEFLD